MKNMASGESKVTVNQHLKPKKCVLLTAQIFLRILIIATTLSATLVMVTSKQIIHIGDFVLVARYSYSPSFKFFACANAIACALTGLSLLFFFSVEHHHGDHAAHFFLLFLHDLLMMSLVLAGCAAATAVGLLGKNGNDHAGWVAICDNFPKFCNRSTTSMILSYFSLLFLLVLTIISACKSRHTQILTA